MGSPTVSNAKPIPMENTEKKSIKTLLKSLLFNKKKEKPKIEKQKPPVEEKPEIKKDVKKQNNDTVATILDNFNKLNLEDKKTVKREPEEEDDELNNFAFKVIEVPRNERIYSHSSEDSGFSDTKDVDSEKAENDDKDGNDDPEGDDTEVNDTETTEGDDEKTEDNEHTDDLADNLQKLDINGDKQQKNKKLQKVAIIRGPTKNRVCHYTQSVAPYPISQINPRTLTGGQVIVNHTQTDNLSEVSQISLTEALERVRQSSQSLQSDHETYFQDVMELIKEDTKSQSIPKLVVTPDFESRNAIDYESTKKQNLVDYEQKNLQNNDLMQLLQETFFSSETMACASQEYGQEDFTQIVNYVQKEYSSTSNDGFIPAYTYPTPPRSETAPSPMTASPGSFYPSNSEYTLSPGRSPIYNSDYERYQEIPHFEENEPIDNVPLQRTASVSSMTLKQFKDMQKEISSSFSKKECCQITRKSCKELFQERLKKLTMPVRKGLCVEMSKMDLKYAYGVLESILINMCPEKEDVQISLFGLICERILGQNPALFVEDAGLNLLKSAALRCSDKPLLTRYLVQCIRTAITSDPSLVADKEYVFREVDPLGDNLVIACARAGDRCADVLSEIVRAHDGQPPLFRLRHTNADGYTALHVACSQHSPASPRLHTVHVLLVHAGFEITEGDQKGGDTALHLAVNSAHCDLQLILMIFKQVDRKDWKNLAHCHNLSTKTPLDLARLATKTSTRQNYPHEVLDFLKKCR